MGFKQRTLIKQQNNENNLITKHLFEPLSRRRFITRSGAALAALALPTGIHALTKTNSMNDKKIYDVIIIGGSYSGLAAGMALGRALREVLIIDSGQPGNSQTPFSHNFITHDGKPPKEIALSAKQQVEKYPTVEFLKGTVTGGNKIQNRFEIQTGDGQIYKAKKLVFATGIKDLMPDIEGFSACWGISALHCPYCHGYEVKNETTGVLANGLTGYELGVLISNWTKDLTLYTNGPSTLSAEQKEKLERHGIGVVEKQILRLEQVDGHVQHLVFSDGTRAPMKALYSRLPFKQHSELPEKLGCELTDEGYIRTNPFQQTTVDGIYACGDNAIRLRTIANAVAAGTTAGMMVNKALVEENF